MAVAVDFSNSFWGDKHMGFSTLYQNMKCGQYAVKELSEFLKERAVLEEEHCKLLAKSLNKVSVFASGTDHNCTSLWILTKNSLERAQQTSTRLHAALSEVLKDTHTYADELHKAQREFKHKATLDAVNLMQTTTTCLQKAKETYFTRCIELDKMRQDPSVNAKEVARAEAKKTKAAEEYKTYIEKYDTVSSDFQTKLRASAVAFQEHEMAFICRIQSIFVQFVRSYEDAYVLHSQIFGELRKATENLDIYAILAHFAETQGTGTIAPPPIFFEEPDLALMSNSPRMPHKSGASSTSNAGMIAMAAAANHAGPSPSMFSLGLGTDTNKNDLTIRPSESTTDNNLISLSPAEERPPPLPTTKVPPLMSLDLMETRAMNNISSSTTVEQAPKSPASTSSNADSCVTADSSTAQPAQNVQATSSTSKLSLSNFLMPGRSKKANVQEHHNVEQMNSVLSTSLPAASFADNAAKASANADAQHSLGGFLKKHKHKRNSTSKKKADSEIVDQNFQSFDETRSETSSRSDEAQRSNAMATIDEEGYTIRPHESTRHHAHQKSPRQRWSNDEEEDSSSSDSDDLLTSKVKQLRIKPIDELGAGLAGSEASPDASNSSPGADISLLKEAVNKLSLSHLAGPYSSGGLGVDPWGGRLPMRPSLTGNAERTAPAHTMPSRQPLQASLTGGTARARPRAYTPTNQLFSQTLQTRGERSASDTTSDNEHTVHGQRSRSDSITSLGGGLRPAYSMTSLCSTDSLPVAMAITETMHAWFSRNDAAPAGDKRASATKCRVRVFGSVFISFPAKALPFLVDSVLSAEPASADSSTLPRTALTFSLINAERVNALIPNRQVLAADTLSAFTSASTHVFSFGDRRLAEYLHKERMARPHAPYHNVEVLRYEVRQPVPLLEVQAFWKTETQQTDLRIDYALNTTQQLNSALLNVTFSTEVNGNMTNVLAKPEAKWSTDSTSLVWLLTELSTFGEPSGSLKARALLEQGPSTPAPVHVKFTASDTTVSGTSLELTNDAYRLSLLKRKVVTGKYFADALTR